MTFTVFVDGQEGTTGLRIHEYLAQRADVEVLSIDPERRKDPTERARLLNAADVAFLCLPDAAAREAVAALDESFFRVRFDRLTPAEKLFLRGMAELGNQACRIGDLAELLQVKVGSLSPRRAALIHKGMIYSPSHGDLDFTVPLFGEFMRRQIPDFPPK
jgi:hypothetical protein